MKRPLRAAIAAAAAVVTLAFASAAMAANTGSLTVWHTPMSLASSTATTTIHVNVPQASDPVAAVNIYSGTGYTLNTSQPAGTKIGTVEATAFSRDNNLTLPLSGTVVTDNPANNVPGSTQCARTPNSKAVWMLNLSVAGQSLVIPAYVNDTAGAEQALGGYKISICLPPPDVPVGTPGRAFQGAQLLDAKLTLDGGVFTTPTGGGLIKWESLFTPYNPGKGTPNAAGTFETRSFVPLPIIVGLQAKYTKKTRKYTLSGRVSEGGKPGDGLSVVILAGKTAAGVKKVATKVTTANGTFSYSGKLKKKTTTYFAATSSAGERDYTATGCQNPLTAVAPAGCVKATLSPWSFKSPTVRIKS